MKTTKFLLAFDALLGIGKNLLNPEEMLSVLFEIDRKVLLLKDKFQDERKQLSDGEHE
jgi:hypothetical protein